jgi:DNA topoisomerase-1
MDLIIVESPAKARTIGKFLGKNFCVEACMGHIRDLPKKRLGVDVADNFKPTYVTIPGRSKVIKLLKKKSEKMEKVYLGADHDREGEAICWHLKELLGRENGLYRISFNEITAHSIREAVKNPALIDLHKVDAQQARRILDRLVGYMVSPLLWRKVRKGLSAGRVQSVALRLICEREDEIKSFTPEEYWSITAQLEKQDGQKFSAKLEKIGKVKVKLPGQEKAQSIVEELKGEKFIVKSVKHVEEQKNPPPPFITSSLQQEASSLLGFGARRTMLVAQQLYEGLDIGEEGRTGLITYMRTDSVRVSKEAQKMCLKFIREKFGAEFAPQKPRSYKSKKGAQEAHEAIRPTEAWREPGKLENFLTPEQLKLYRLIWCKFLASQCKPACFKRMRVRITAGKFEFSASGSKILFQGFMIVYSKGHLSGRQGADEKRAELPHLEEREVLNLIELLPEQHFTKPPPRYSEGTLVKALEEKGIGRPSTYAPIISTIQGRGYVEKKERRLFPVELGMMVNKLLVANLGDYFDVKFTAKMESDLDKIEEGEVDWTRVVESFYQPFEVSIEKAKQDMENLKQKLVEETDEICDKCGGKLVIRFGRYGRFIACSSFPKCRNTRPIIVETGMNCSVPGCSGKIIERRTKRGRLFYGCSKYPDCDFVSWYKPVPVKCEKCGASFLVEKRTKSGQVLQCVQPECDYERIYSEIHHLSGS